MPVSADSSVLRDPKVKTIASSGQHANDKYMFVSILHGKVSGDVHIRAENVNRKVWLDPCEVSTCPFVSCAFLPSAFRTINPILKHSLMLSILQIVAVDPAPVLKVSCDNSAAAFPSTRLFPREGEGEYLTCVLFVDKLVRRYFPSRGLALALRMVSLARRAKLLSQSL